MAKKNSWHRYDMKKLRHCHPMYLLWRWPLLSFRVGFSYIVRIICDGLCSLSKYRFWILIVCWLLPLYKHLHLVAPLVPKSVTSYSIWPLVSYLFRWFLRSQPFFERDAYCTARPCYSSLSVLPSVRPSVSRKVCPRCRAVSLRQLSFLSKFVHWQIHQWICNKIVINYPTTP